MKSSNPVAGDTRADVSQTTAAYEAGFSNALAHATQSAAANMCVENAEGSAKLRSFDALCRDSAAIDIPVTADWNDLVTPESKASFLERGLEHLLAPPMVLTYSRGIEEPADGALPIYATIDEIFAVEPLERRAFAIIANEIYGKCPASRALIESVKEAGVVGCMVQARLQYPPMTIRKIWPSWYRRYKAPPRDLRAGNLFEAFGIDINGGGK